MHMAFKELGYAKFYCRYSAIQLQFPRAGDKPPRRLTPAASRLSRFPEKSFRYFAKYFVWVEIHRNSKFI
jgi:hypothetical protein